jgi:hypothetical protein
MSTDQTKGKWIAREKRGEINKKKGGGNNLGKGD